MVSKFRSEMHSLNLLQKSNKVLDLLNQLITDIKVSWLCVVWKKREYPMEMEFLQRLRRWVFHKGTVTLDEEEEMKIPSGIQI